MPIDFLLHELGHFFACCLLGGEAKGIGIDIAKGYAYTLCSCKEVIPNLIILCSGSLFPLIISFIILLMFRNIYSYSITLLCLGIEGFQWILGGFIDGTDIVKFCMILGLNPIYFGIFLIPFMIIATSIISYQFYKIA